MPVYDWWSARQRQLTFHAGEPRPGEERHAVQFFAYPADRSPPWGTVAVYEFSNSKLRHMTVHPGEPWPDETRGEMLFHALPPPEQPQCRAAERRRRIWTILRLSLVWVVCNLIQ